MKTIRRRFGHTGRVLLALALVGALLGTSSPQAFAQEVERSSPIAVVADLGTTSPESPSPIPPSKAARADDELAFPGLVQTAIRLIKQGNYPQAIALLEPYRAKADFSMLHALGVAYVRTQRNQEAYDTLLRAHDLAPLEPGPLLPAALACVRMANSCDNYRELAVKYKELGGTLVRFADKIANHQSVALTNVLRRR